MQISRTKSGGMKTTSEKSGLSPFFGFETGTLDHVAEVNNLIVVSDRVYEGSYAAYSSDALNEPQATIRPNAYILDREPTTFRVFLQETADSAGHGVRLWNANDNVEVGIATNNPQWDIDDGNGVTQVFGGDGYDRWLRFTLTFDWVNSTFSTDLEDLSSGSTFSDTGRPLKFGDGVSYITLEGYNAGTWSGGFSTAAWWDNIELVI